jgi:hypothetical protein
VLDSKPGQSYLSETFSHRFQGFIGLAPRVGIARIGRRQVSRRVTLASKIKAVKTHWKKSSKSDPVSPVWRDNVNKVVLFLAFLFLVIKASTTMVIYMLQLIWRHRHQ